MNVEVLKLVISCFSYGMSTISFLSDCVYITNSCFLSCFSLNICYFLFLLYFCFFYVQLALMPLSEIEILGFASSTFTDRVLPPSAFHKLVYRHFLSDITKLD